MEFKRMKNSKLPRMFIHAAVSGKAFIDSGVQQGMLKR